MDDTFRIEFDNDGTLRQWGREGWREPVCPECNEGIRYVLDMASWKQDDRGGFVLCHARRPRRYGNRLDDPRRAVAVDPAGLYGVHRRAASGRGSTPSGGRGMTEQPPDSAAWWTRLVERWQWHRRWRERAGRTATVTPKRSGNDRFGAGLCRAAGADRPATCAPARLRVPLRRRDRRSDRHARAEGGSVTDTAATHGESG